MRLDVALERVQVMNRKTWTELLRASGFTDADLRRWHRDFERLDPAGHQRFLEFLGIADREIGRIRSWSRARVPATAPGSRPPRGGRPPARGPFGPQAANAQALGRGAPARERSST
jgi:hypothetical protein